VGRIRQPPVREGVGGEKVRQLVVIDGSRHVAIEPDRRGARERQKTDDEG
jgi:hypothetical protein